MDNLPVAGLVAYVNTDEGDDVNTKGVSVATDYIATSTM